MVYLPSQPAFPVLRERDDMLRGIVDDDGLQALLQRLFLFLYAESGLHNTTGFERYYV